MTFLGKKNRLITLFLDTSFPSTKSLSDSSDLDVLLTCEISVLHLVHQFSRWRWSKESLPSKFFPSGRSRKWKLIPTPEIRGQGESKWVNSPSYLPQLYKISLKKRRGGQASPFVSFSRQNYLSFFFRQNYSHLFAVNFHFSAQLAIWRGKHEPQTPAVIERAIHDSLTKTRNHIYVKITTIY